VENYWSIECINNYNKWKIMPIILKRLFNYYLLLKRWVVGNMNEYNAHHTLIKYKIIWCKKDGANNIFCMFALRAEVIMGVARTHLGSFTSYTHRGLICHHISTVLIFNTLKSILIVLPNNHKSIYMLIYKFIKK